MEYSLTLPKDNARLAEIVAQHIDREEDRLSFRRATWLVAYYYLLGARHFDVYDPDSGAVRFSWTGEGGSFEFQSTELLSAVDRVQGRLMSMDFMPLVQRRGNSLPAIRSRAIGQVVADAMVSEQQLQTIVRDFTHIFTLLGSCGITSHIMTHPTIGLTADLEIVHPKELFPFPSVAQDMTKAMGMVRQRMVPMDFLLEKFGNKITSNKQKLEYWEVYIGDIFAEEDDRLPYGGSLTIANTGNRSTGGGGPKTSDSGIMEVAKVREVWITGPNEICTRYILTCGAYTIEDVDLTGHEVYCPIGFARFMDNGTWHGAGMFDLMFPLIREAEKLVKTLFENVRSIDRYGVLVLPQGSYNANTMLRDIGHGLRVVPWEPDPISEGFKPFSIQPFNSGDVPGKTAAFAHDLMDRVNPIRDLIQEKGRVDSAVGLSFLDEQINRAMSSPTFGISQAFGNAYRAIVSDASREIMLSPAPLPVGRLTTDLAGAVIDPVTMEVNFENNPLPNVSKLSFGIRQRHPRSEVARKQEALQMQERFQLDLDTFLLFSMKESLDFAMWSDEHQSAFEMVTRNILILYGDGESPGEIMITPDNSKPEFQMRVLVAFMSGPLLSVASVEVQNAFITFRHTLLDFSGLSLPQALPNPEDLAILTQIEQSRGGGGQPQPDSQIQIPQAAGVQQ